MLIPRLPSSPACPSSSSSSSPSCLAIPQNNNTTSRLQRPLSASNPATLCYTKQSPLHLPHTLALLRGPAAGAPSLRFFCRSLPLHLGGCCWDEPAVKVAGR